MSREAVERMHEQAREAREREGGAPWPHWSDPHPPVNPAVERERRIARRRRDLTDRPVVGFTRPIPFVDDGGGRGSFAA